MTFVALNLGAGQTGAEARPRFPFAGFGCGLRNFSWSISGPWSATELGILANGIQSWNGYRGRSGSPLFSSTSGPQVTYLRLGPGELDQTVCSASGIRVEVSATIGVSWLAHVAAHETGHVHGLGHDGAFDLLSSDSTYDTPLMRGCGDTVTGPRSDDLAQASFRYDGKVVTPNSGFENLGGWFGTYTRSTVALSGDWGGQVNGGQTAWRPVRLSPSPSVLGVRLAYKHGSANAGSIKFKYRTVNYGPGPTGCGNAYNPSSYNWNSPVPGVWVDANAWALPSTGGAWKGEPPKTVSVPSGAEGFDLRVSVFAPSDQAIFVDNVEVYQP